MRGSGDEGVCRISRPGAGASVRRDPDGAEPSKVRRSTLPLRPGSWGVTEGRSVSTPRQEALDALGAVRSGMLRVALGADVSSPELDRVLNRVGSASNVRVVTDARLLRTLRPCPSCSVIGVARSPRRTS